VLNFTQRDYAFMRAGPGFRGSLTNVDLGSDPSIDHLTIDKSPRLHARVISEVLAIVGGHPTGAPVAKPATATAAEPPGTEMGAKTTLPGEAAAKTTDAPTGSVPATSPSHQPAAAPRAIDPAQIPD
jgi:hypothetical protein